MDFPELLIGRPMNYSFWFTFPMDTLLRFLVGFYMDFVAKSLWNSLRTPSCVL